MKNLIPGNVYTFAQLVSGEYDLRDSACLTFNTKLADGSNVHQTVSDSHVSEANMLTVPGFADSLWIYVRETSEWIPIFRFADTNVVKVEQLFDMEPHIDPFAEREGTLWITPKGFPREQYYRLDVGNNIIVSDSGDIYDIPVFDSSHKSTWAYNPGICHFCRQDVVKRVVYRDPEEGNCREYDACESCVKNRREAERKAYAEEREWYERYYG